MSDIRSTLISGSRGQNRAIGRGKLVANIGARYQMEQILSQQIWLLSKAFRRI